MAQSGWRLPDELLKRVRVRCAEEGVRQNEWVEQALEKALGDIQGTVGPAMAAADPRGRSSRPASPRTSAKPKAKPAAGLPNIAPRHWAK